jgi:hypothetical protein
VLEQSAALGAENHFHHNPAEYVVRMLTSPIRGRVAEAGCCDTRLACRVRRSRLASRQGSMSGPKPLVNQAACEYSRSIRPGPPRKRAGVDH